MYRCVTFALIVSIVCCYAMATHNYQGQDEDELSFKKGQIILVIPYEDPEDQV